MKYRDFYADQMILDHGACAVCTTSGTVVFHDLKTCDDIQRRERIKARLEEGKS